jgi:carbon storage regulator CsrA
MLVLTRNTHQSVLIHTLDGIIEVTIAEIKDGKVKLGFDAPCDVLIMRKEINDSDAYEN